MGGNVASGKVVLARFETGNAIYIGVVIAGVQVSILADEAVGI